MEEERERHSCAVVVVQSLETCNVRGGNTEEQDGTPLLAALEVTLSPLPVCGDGKTDRHGQWLEMAQTFCIPHL